MIETCTRKRMVLAILLLFSLTLVTLIMEGMWSSHHSPAELNSGKEIDERKCHVYNPGINIFGVSTISCLEDNACSIDAIDMQFHVKNELGLNEEQKCTSSEVSVIKSCQPCSDFDLKSEVAYCERTGYKEEVKCNGDSLFRSCKVDPWIAERKFWMFQLITCLLGFFSYSVVHYRQDKLDKMLTDKVNRQIAA